MRRLELDSWGRIWFALRQFRSSGQVLKICFDATIDRVDGGYSSAAERLTVAQDVVGSIPTSRPTYKSNEGVDFCLHEYWSAVVH